MRKTSSLDPLLSRSVQELLSALILERSEPWYLSDLAHRLRRSPSTLQRPLDSLVKAGILRRWSDGNRVYFARDVDCPFLPELRGLLEKTTGLADVLRRALRSFGKRISLAFVYGSIAKGRERSTSDVDLIVVGDITLADLSSALARSERRLRRPVNATVYSVGEFREKIAKRNHFLRSVLESDRIFLAGTPDDLEELVGRRPSRNARHE
ncbi:MAG: nucleotidyltransferase domain-containing protein [Pirellulales bacterium]